MPRPAVLDTLKAGNLLADAHQAACPQLFGESGQTNMLSRLLGLRAQEAPRLIFQCNCMHKVLTWGLVSTSHLKYECSRSLGSRNLKFGLPACLTRSTNSVWPPDPRTNLAVCMMTCGAAKTCQVRSVGPNDPGCFQEQRQQRYETNPGMCVQRFGSICASRAICTTRPQGTASELVWLGGPTGVDDVQAPLSDMKHRPQVQARMISDSPDWCARRKGRV